MTGASGCIGQYIAEALIEQTDCELFLFLRDPAKLAIDPDRRDGVHIIVGDLNDIGQHADLLTTMHCAILTAAAWGGAATTHDINVSRTLQLVNLLDPAVCDRVIYFSTASLLDRGGEILREAAHFGTDYIRTKYDALSQIRRSPLADRLTVLFPTLVWGGDDRKRQSHLNAGLPEIFKWSWLLRFIKLDGSFHNIHARDIAQVVTHLVTQPDREYAPQSWVLGGKPYSVNDALAEICRYCGQSVGFRVELRSWLLEAVIKIFNIQLASWDRFCLDYRHFVYDGAIDPAKLGMVPFCASLSDIFEVSSVPKQDTIEQANEPNEP
ncbi:MAG: NAD-dependent epimerase/dehydratase family protein [Geitlerinemataceae cyanobacterium]